MSSNSRWWLQAGQKIGRDAAKFQYLLQILQVNFQDYIPKWQIFVEQDDDFPKMILKWRCPSTVWDGQPAIGFMAETNFKEMLKEIFHQKWALQTSIQCDPFQRHLSSRATRTSPSAWMHRIFERIHRSQKMLWLLRVPSSSSRHLQSFKALESSLVESFCHLLMLQERRRIESTAQRHGSMPTSMTPQQPTVIYFQSKEQRPFLLLD